MTPSARKSSQRGGDSPKPDSSPTPEVLASMMSVVAMIAEFAAAALPAPVKPGEVPENLAAQPEIKPSGIAAGHFATGKSTALPTPASGPAQRSAQTGNETDAAGATAGAAEFHAQPATVKTTSKPPVPGSMLDPQPGTLNLKPDAGTAVAQQDTTMKTATKKTNFSGAEQKLPACGPGSGATAPAAGENLPAAAKRADAGSVRSQRHFAPASTVVRVESATPASAGISSQTDATRTVSPEIFGLPRSVPANPAYVERTREMISLQAVQLQTADTDEMRVVIKPDAGLQLSLNLHQRGDRVEVLAVLDRGNFDLLNQHWPELQQQLESRGVRVAPLANADSFLGGGSAGFRQSTASHGQHAGEDGDPAPAATGTAALLCGLPAATASASGISSTHLETWA